MTKEQPRPALVHQLQCTSEEYKAIQAEVQRHLVCLLPLDFQVGDFIALSEVEQLGKPETGQRLGVIITYITPQFWHRMLLEYNANVLSIRLVEKLH